MQFKIDENMPIEIAELLNDAGHDAKTVNNQQLLFNMQLFSHTYKTWLVLAFFIVISEVG
jgi:hypothetical protein